MRVSAIQLKDKKRATNQRDVAVTTPLSYSIRDAHNYGLPLISAVLFLFHRATPFEMHAYGLMQGLLLMSVVLLSIELLHSRCTPTDRYTPTTVEMQA